MTVYGSTVTGIPYRSPQPPLIDDIDDLLTRKQMAEWFGVSERHISQYIYGDYPLPFFRFNRRYWFSKRQVAWWFGQMQGKADPMTLDIRRVQREAKRAKGRKT